jgi:hypothetical protein
MLCKCSGCFWGGECEAAGVAEATFLEDWWLVQGEDEPVEVPRCAAKILCNGEELEGQDDSCGPCKAAMDRDAEDEDLAVERWERRQVERQQEQLEARYEEDWEEDEA